MKIVGLTGGIGMGKSAAAAAFRREGLLVFDADAEVHRLQRAGGRALPAIAAAFPGVVREGVLDRAALRLVVLADRTALARLEAIIHPMVGAARRRFLAQAKGAQARGAGEAIVVLDVPLLFETGGDRGCDLIVVVSAPASVQRQRLRARRRMDEAQIDAVLALQMPDAQKRRRADVVIRTGLSRFHAQRAIRRLVLRMRSFGQAGQITRRRPRPPAPAPDPRRPRPPRRTGRVADA